MLWQCSNKHHPSPRRGTFSINPGPCVCVCCIFPKQDNEMMVPYCFGQPGYTDPRRPGQLMCPGENRAGRRDASAGGDRRWCFCLAPGCSLGCSNMLDRPICLAFLAMLFDIVHSTVTCLDVLCCAVCRPQLSSPMQRTSCAAACSF